VILSAHTEKQKDCKKAQEREGSAKKCSVRHAQSREAAEEYSPRCKRWVQTENLTSPEGRKTRTQFFSAGKHT
jgi:hypothetical protein